MIKGVSTKVILQTSYKRSRETANLLTTKHELAQNGSEELKKLFKLAIAVFGVHSSRFGSTPRDLALFRYYAQCGGNYLPTFRDNLPVNGIGSLSRNVDNCHHTLPNNPEEHGLFPKHSLLAFFLEREYNLMVVTFTTLCTIYTS
jgi:hypothetical protein